MPNGTIARLLIDKGFGFIRDESGVEHFFTGPRSVRPCSSSCAKASASNSAREDSPKGPRAAEVRLLD
jgi:cold shock CspA family protein